MLKGIFGKLKNNTRLVLNLFILASILYLFLTTRWIESDSKEMFDELATRLDSVSQSQFRLEQSKHPKVTSNEDFNGEKTNFTFSPDKKIISFVQNVFEEYGADWNKYWALKIFDPNTGVEKTLVVDDTKMSSYEWVDNTNLRVFHDAGTGVRIYLDTSVYSSSTFFTRDHEGTAIWIPDMEYSQKAKDTVESRRIYLEKTQR